jgi:Na+:H+ antiporter, NhaC family
MQEKPDLGPARDPSYLDAIIPLVVLAGLVASAVGLFGLDATAGPMQVAMLFAAMVTAGILLKNGHKWEAIAAAGRKGVSSVVSAIFILFAVGALIGTWNMSGTIPTMVYYGIQFINANWFYLATTLICAAISLGIGSSWTTAGTIGVGLVGLASLIGLSPAIAAGAVVSGSYVGDKLSPLSETTILAAQLTDTKLHAHLRAQLWTSLPGLMIAVIGFTLIGLLDGSDGAKTQVIVSELSSLDTLFWITPLNLIPLVFLVVLSLLRVPSSLAIMGSALVAGFMACLLQPQAVLSFVDDPSMPVWMASIKGVWQAIASGYQANSGVAVVDELISRGGMDSMLGTVWLIIGALVLGTLLDEFGLLSKLMAPVLLKARRTGSLIATVAGTALGLNIVAGDQYVALVLPARLFSAEFRNRNLASTNLSRAVADSGTVTSPLIPWNSCGAYMAAVLGVPTFLYMPFCFFNIAGPVLTVLYGFTGFKIEHIGRPAAPEIANGTSTEVG